MWCKVFSLVGLAMLMVVNSNAEASARGDIRFRILQKSIVAVPVFINGQGPFAFVLDTGTETSVVDQELACALGLHAVDHLTLYTPSGRKDLARTFLPEISLGTASEIHVEVLIDSSGNFSSLGAKIRGVLGQNFLSQFDLLLDYEHARIHLFDGEREAPIQGEHIPLQLRGGLPVLTVKIADGSTLDLLLDSGASALTIFKTEIAGFHSDSFRGRGKMKTLVAETQTIQGVIPMLSVGDVWLRNPTVFLARKPAGDPVDGMLPGSLFSSIYISNREGYAIVRR